MTSPADEEIERAIDNVMRFSCLADWATKSNSVDVAFGLDMDGNGTLDRHKTAVVVGWDSGEWFFRDRRACVEMHEARPSGSRKLDWRLSLDENLKATSLSATDIDGIVFSGLMPPTMFDTNWNMMRVTARGLSESLTAPCRAESPQGASWSSCGDAGASVRVLRIAAGACAGGAAFAILRTSEKSEVELPILTKEGFE